MVDLFHADCLDEMKNLDENSIDAIVTDPPAGIAFMGKNWDNHNKYVARTEKGNSVFLFLTAIGNLDAWEAGFVAFTVDWAMQALRVLKPGAHGLVWALPRTSDLTGLGLRLAGFEIRDNIYHLFGSGFPKSMDVSKAIDANSPATDEAKFWDGWGTALKPGAEEWILIRKPFIGTVAENVLKNGTGGINVDACRVPITDGAKLARSNGEKRSNYFNYTGSENNAALHGEPRGRWPANVVTDGSEVIPDEAARFFYCAKASKADREKGLEEFEAIHRENGNKWTDVDYRVQRGERNASRETGPRKNNHPTVKPTALMCWLCNLVTPLGGTVLDPFMGSGSTGKACVKSGFGFIGIERDLQSFNTAKARINAEPCPLFSDSNSDEG